MEYSLETERHLTFLQNGNIACSNIAVIGMSVAKQQLSHNSACLLYLRKIEAKKKFAKLMRKKWLQCKSINSAPGRKINY